MSRLFHGVVLAGTALGCGGRSSDPRTSGDGTSNATTTTTDEEAAAEAAAPGDSNAVSGPAASPSECEHPAQFTCIDFDLFAGCAPGALGCNSPAGNCRCDGERPSEPSACANPEQFTCEAFMYDGRAIGCRCDETAPTDPSNCATPQQFRCELTDPRSNCVCDPEAPNDASECRPARGFVCQSYDPPVGCQCIATILVR